MGYGVMGLLPQAAKEGSELLKENSSTEKAWEYK